MHASMPVTLTIKAAHYSISQRGWQVGVPNLCKLQAAKQRLPGLVAHGGFDIAPEMAYNIGC